VKATVIGVGSELIVGDTLDTNTAAIAASLSDHGVSVVTTHRVADEAGALVQILKESLDRYDLVITTGGLGPTPDDLTREAWAEALERPLILDETMLKHIEAFFTKMGKTMLPLNKKQAKKPQGARWLPNPRGTAPGFWLPGHPTAVALPGPPHEWRPMWQQLVPRLGLPSKATVKRTFKTFGVGESEIADLLGDLLGPHDGFEVATYAKLDGVRVVVWGRENEVQRASETVLKRLKKTIWGRDKDTLPGLVYRRLKHEGHTLAVMESVTGGLVAKLITDVPGASAVFLGGMVSYSVGAKAHFGVSEAVLREHGTVSEAAALAMAEAARVRLGATYGLSVTGVAGPEPLEGQPVGRVFVAVAGPSGKRARAYLFPDQGREVIRQRAAYAAFAFFWSMP